MSGTSVWIVTIGAVIGSAGIAWWVLVRYPSAGPRTLSGAIGTCILAFALLQAVGPIVAIASHVGRAFALVGTVVPILVFAFWSGGVLIRAFVAKLGRLGP